MIIKGKYFPSQEKEEKVFLLIRKHWFKYVIFVYLVVLALIPVIGLFIYFSLANVVLSAESTVFLIILMSVYFLLLIGVELYGFVNYYLDVYIVTDRRLVDISQKGLFRREISELHLRQVQDVSAHVDGVPETLFHFGNVFIQTAGETKNFIFESIPHPYAVAKQIVDLHEKQIGRKSVSSLSGTYDEEQLEKGISVGNIEKQAKKLVNDKTLATKPSHGLYIYKGSDSEIADKSVQDVVAPNEGATTETKEPEEAELPEGKEIQL